MTRIVAMGATALLIATVAVSSATVSSAHATEPSPAEPGTAETGAAEAIEATMMIDGYDAAAAQAHGYRIDTAADGTQSSVPVTDEAKRDDALAIRSSATGTCGTAWLTVTPIAAKGGVNIYTAYSLSKGRTSFGHLWNVSGQSRLGAPFDESFSGINNFDGSWSATHFRGLYGYSHGSASLHVSNLAKLTNGGICTAKLVVNAW